MAVLPFMGIQFETVALACMFIYNTQWELPAADGIGINSMPLRLFICRQWGIPGTV